MSRLNREQHLDIYTELTGPRRQNYYQEWHAWYPEEFFAIREMFVDQDLEEAVEENRKFDESVAEGKP